MEKVNYVLGFRHFYFDEWVVCSPKYHNATAKIIGVFIGLTPIIGQLYHIKLVKIELLSPTHWGRFCYIEVH